MHKVWAVGFPRREGHSLLLLFFFITANFKQSCYLGTSNRLVIGCLKPRNWCCFRLPLLINRAQLITLLLIESGVNINTKRNTGGKSFSKRQKTLKEDPERKLPESLTNSSLILSCWAVKKSYLINFHSLLNTRKERHRKNIFQDVIYSMH